MTTAYIPTVLPRPRVGQHLVLDFVSWDYYDRTLRELDGQHWRISFDEGRLEIMTLGDLHEQIKGAARRVVECFATERDIPITSMGSVTCRREDMAKGLEPDECYYVNRPTPRPGKGQLDLVANLAPDLAIEIDISNSSVPRLPIYAALNVIEILRFDGQKWTSLHRQADGEYMESKTSIALPDFPMDMFEHFVKLAMETSQHAAVKELRLWIQQHPSLNPKAS